MAQLVTIILTFLLAIGLNTSSAETTDAKKKPKKLPKKIEVPAGYIPVDPSQVKVNDKLYNDAEAEAQNALVKDKNFEGVIQFIRGEVLWTEAGKQPDPQYKTILKKGDTLKIGNNSFVKIVTQKRCIGIVYGPVELSTPKSSENEVWMLENSSLRWICPGKTEEKLSIDGKPLTLFSGEIFYHKEKLLVIAGEPEAENNTLEAKKIYSGKSTQWHELKPQPPEFNLWTMNQELPVPKESNIWPEPPKPRKYRFSFGPQFGSGITHYDSDTVNNKIPSEFKGGRLTGYFHQGKKVYTLSLMNVEHSKPDNGVHATVKFNTLSFGMRLEPEKKWSLTYRIGLGSADMQVGYQGPSSYFNHNIHYGLLTVTAGFDRIFTFEGWNWLGLLVSGEAQLATTLGSPDLRDGPPQSGDPLSGLIQNSPLSAIDFIIHVAPVFYF